VCDYRSDDVHGAVSGAYGLYEDVVCGECREEGIPAAVYGVANFMFAGSETGVAFVK
jgi:hypothetical protein